MIKVDLSASKVDEQIEVLKHFPELADKHYRPALKRSVSLLASTIRPNIPSLTGESRATFGSKVSGRGFRVRGQVGWYDSGDPWYINIVEHGAKKHDIKLKPQKKTVLAWPGGFSQGHSLSHPGFSARGFMAAGYSAIQPVVDADLAQANERIIADLAAI